MTEGFYRAIAVWAIRRWRRLLEKRIWPEFDPKLSEQLDRVLTVQELIDT